MAEKDRLSYRLGSLGLLAAAIGIIFIVNFLSVRVFSRLDLTQNGQFTLSPSTKKILANLPDVVSIKGVFSSNLPSPYNQFPREVMDLLREYQQASRGKIDLQLIDPVGKESVQEDLRKLGINSMPLPVRGMDQNSVINIWASIYVQYLDRTEIIPMAFSPQTIEYDLTSAISRVLNEKRLKVGMLNVDPDRDLQREFGQLMETLGKEFEVSEVSTSGGKPIDQEIKVLIVASPHQISDRDLFEIDHYLMKGGQAIFLADGAMVYTQRGQYGTPMPVMGMALNEGMDNLGKLLTFYGVKRNYDLVMDRSSQQYPVLGNMLGYKYPLFPQEDMEGQVSNPITQGVDHLTFTWASSLEVQTLPATVKAVKLVVTSPESWVQAGQQLMVDPMGPQVPPLPMPGMGPAQRTLVVLLSGKFPSYFKGKDVPGLLAAGDTASPPPPPPPPVTERVDESPAINIMIVGCSRFVSDQTPVTDMGSNLAFMNSAVEYMTGGSQLSDIQKRKLEARPLKDLTRGKIILVGLVAPFLAPLGVIVFGVARFAVRRRSRNQFLESVKP